MIYISTDYVFDGESKVPYETDSHKNPLSVYGKSKLIGEEAVICNLEKHYILRTSWLFGENGDCFPDKILKLAKNARELNIVDDQLGSPTYTADLAKLLCNMILSFKYGIYHATNEGYCTWAELAREAMSISGIECTVNGIKSQQYPAKATRPKNSRLSKKCLDRAGFEKLPCWCDALGRYIKNSKSAVMPILLLWYILTPLLL